MAKKQKVKFKSLKIHEDTQEMLQYLSKLLNKSQAQILSEYVKHLTEIACSIKGKANITYEESVLAQSITIYLHGQSLLQVGSFSAPTSMSDEEVDKEVLKRLGELENE